MLRRRRSGNKNYISLGRGEGFKSKIVCQGDSSTLRNGDIEAVDLEDLMHALAT